jgi:hypothetical protein
MPGLSCRPPVTVLITHALHYPVLAVAQAHLHRQNQALSESQARERLRQELMFRIHALRCACHMCIRHCEYS